MPLLVANESWVTRVTVVPRVSAASTSASVMADGRVLGAQLTLVLLLDDVVVIGYGVQGPAQSLNMRDNGFNVIVGQAKSFKNDWDRAVKDG